MKIGKGILSKRILRVLNRKPSSFSDISFQYNISIQCNTFSYILLFPGFIMLFAIETETKLKSIKDKVVFYSNDIKNMKVYFGQRLGSQTSKILHTNVAAGDLFSARFPPNGSKGSCFAVTLALSNAVKGSAAKPFYGMVFSN